MQSSLDWVAVSLSAASLARSTVTSQVYPPDIGHAAAAPPTGATKLPTPLSDHVPVITTFEARRPKPTSARPIPLWIVRHPLYAVAAARTLRRIPDSAAPADRQTASPGSGGDDAQYVLG